MSPKKHGISRFPIVRTARVAALMALFCGVAVGLCSGLTDPVLDAARQERTAQIAEAYVAEGREDLARGHSVRAVRILSEAIRRGASGEVFRLRSQAHALNGDISEAVSDISRFIASGASSASDRVVRGDLYLAMSRYSDALEDYDRALTLDPRFVDAHRGRGLACIALERYRDAAQSFRTVLRAAPDDPEALINLGMARSLEGAYGSAFRLWNKALEGKISDVWRVQVSKWLDELPDRAAAIPESEEGPDEPAENAEPAVSAADERDAHVGSAPGSRERFGHGSAQEASELSVGPARDARDVKRILESSPAPDQRFTGTAKGSHMGFAWTLTFETRGRDVTGNLRVVWPTGHEETHRCRGTFERGFLDASDGKGHRFHGRVTEDFRLLGMLRTPEGQSFSVDIPLRD